MEWLERHSELGGSIMRYREERDVCVLNLSFEFRVSLRVVMLIIKGDSKKLLVLVIG